MTQIPVITVLVTCPRCAAAAIFIDGKPQGHVTFFMKNGNPAMTPHIDTCPYRGLETPEE